MDDDLVIIRQDALARNGDIVIALLEDEATCKTLNITPDGVWLMPENPAYPPINGTGCQILGVVKAVYRSLESVGSSGTDFPGHTRREAIRTVWAAAFSGTG